MNRVEHTGKRKGCKAALQAMGSKKGKCEKMENDKKRKNNWKQRRKQEVKRKTRKFGSPRRVGCLV